MKRLSLQELANDDDVRRALAKYQRRGTELPAEPPYKVRMKDVKPTIENLVQRVLSLESQMRKLRGPVR